MDPTPQQDDSFEEVVEEEGVVANPQKTAKLNEKQEKLLHMCAKFIDEGWALAGKYHQNV